MIMYYRLNAYVFFKTFVDVIDNKRVNQAWKQIR